MNILDFNTKLKNHEISAREAVISYLDVIKNKNQKLNAYLETFSAKDGKYDVLLEAQKLDERVKEGETPGVLWGVPFAVKDNILICGKHASAASHILKNYVASYDATAIMQLKKAGAIFLGRTNMDEFAMGSSTENSSYGPAHNPFHFDYVPGGSSGGSAVAVASDMAMAALGSDTGGSIRQPASFCGVVGLKPTYGAVSRSGLIAMASSLDQIGPITQTVDDAEIVFNAIRGKDEFDSTSVDSKIFSKETVSQTNTVKIIGVPKEYFTEGLDPRIKGIIETIIERLSKKYEIREIELPHTKYAIACYY
ncbi:MAG: amidase, partial [Patescibacteria group bacterium]